MANRNRITDWKLWGALAGSLLTGSGVTLTIARPDPFTGKDSKILEQRLQAYSDTQRYQLQAQINELRLSIRLLEQHIRDKEKNERNSH